MDVLCFDIYFTGHHLEFASGLRKALQARDPDLNVEFLALAPGDREHMYFDEEEVDYLYETSPFDGRPDVVPDHGFVAPAYDFLERNVAPPRWSIVRDFANYVEANEYDVVHVLEVGKLQQYLLCHLGEAGHPPTVGSINGVFLKPVRHRIPSPEPLLSFLERGHACAFTRRVPPTLRKGLAWNRWYLRLCAERGVFDYLTVPTEAARDELRSVLGPSWDERVALAPDPTESWEGERIDRAAARRQLDLPVDGAVLLFFGQMREEKGVHDLLAALESYDGPPFTMVLAGPPSAVNEDDVATAAGNGAVDVVSRFEYVPREAVPAYFRAADGVVFPYRRSFGEMRPSNVFQKAAAAGRPVIAADIGVFGRRVREWDLGVLHEPESSEDLARAMAEFVSGGGADGDPESIAAYADTQTFDRLADVVSRAYRAVTAERVEA